MKPGPVASVVTDGIIDYVVSRIAFSVRKYQLKKEVSLILYGPKVDEQGKVLDEDVPRKLVEISAFEKICSKARLILKERAAVNTEEARRESIGFYENLLADDSVDERVRVKARENLDKILSVPGSTHGPGMGYVPVVPLGDSVKIIDIDKLDLSLEQRKKLLEEERKDV